MPRNANEENGMRMIFRHVVAISVAVTPLVSLARDLAAAVPDRVAAVPETRVLLENDCVRVQYHDVAVGQTAPMHSHPHYVVYRLTPSRARITRADGSQRISEHQAGDVSWEEATSHSVENIGSTDIHNLVIELKPGAACH
jgi:quercetin dioxygenase-like cupin family protein